MANYKDLDPFQSSTESTLVIDTQQELGAWVTNDLVSEIGVFKAYLFSLIDALSRKGYCYETDAGFAKRLGIKERAVRGYLKDLEDRNLLYRNTYQTPVGKKRLIVTHKRYKQFWDNFLCRPHVPEIARKNFLKKTFNVAASDCQQTPKKETKKPPNGKNLPLHDVPAKSCRSLLLRNKLEEKTRKQRRSAPPPFLQKLEKELIKIGVPPEDVNKAVEYAKLHPEIEATKDNPTGWFVKGFQDKWIYEKFEAPQSSEAKKEELWEKNKARAHEIEKAAAANKPKYLRIEVSYKAIELVQEGGMGQCVIIGFDNPRFDIELNEQLEKYNLNETHAICN